MNKLMLKLINAYQKGKNKNIKRCRYTPSCSNYAKEAYQKFNFFKASWLTFYRLIRCNPFSKGGFDPVPLTKKEKQLLKQSSKDTLEEGFDATTHVIK